jgi:hypothetical protein
MLFTESAPVSTMCGRRRHIDDLTNSQSSLAEVNNVVDLDASLQIDDCDSQRTTQSLIASLTRPYERRAFVFLTHIPLLLAESAPQSFMPSRRHIDFANTKHLLEVKKVTPIADESCVEYCPSLALVGTPGNASPVRQQRRHQVEQVGRAVVCAHIRENQSSTESLSRRIRTVCRDTRADIQLWHRMLMARQTSDEYHDVVCTWQANTHARVHVCRADNSISS